MSARTIPASDLQAGMTAKVRGLGRKNRTTIYITLIQSSRTREGQIWVWGDNINAPYGQRSQVCRCVEITEQCELVEVPE